MKIGDFEKYEEGQAAALLDLINGEPFANLNYSLNEEWQRGYSDLIANLT